MSQVSIEEIVSLRPPPGDELITKRKRILRAEHDCSGVKLDVSNHYCPADRIQRSGIAREIRTQFPCKAAQDFNAGIIDSASFTYPLQMGFTTESTLYAIRYEITIRAALSRAKDLVSTQPIQVCPWNSGTCSQIMKSIQKASDTVNGRDSYPQNNSVTHNRGKRILVE